MLRSFKKSNLSEKALLAKATVQEEEKVKIISFYNDN